MALTEAVLTCAAGGIPPRFAPWPHHDDDEIEAVVRVLRSGRTNYWTGEECQAFEHEFASACDCRYAVATANGTLALELCLRSLGIGPGDDVIVTPRSFMASVSTIVLCGARPVFADVDPYSQNITADSITAVITPQSRAIVAVHLAGWPCEMEPIRDVARTYGLKIIEDCAQAHGATYNGRPAGSLGDIAAFSFCQDKIISTGGEGGMITTNDPDLWRRAWSYKDHGKNYATSRPVTTATGFRWLHDSFGSNFRLTEPQAALGRLQLRKLPAWLQRRRDNAAKLSARLRHFEALQVPAPGEHIGHSFYKYYVMLHRQKLRPDWNRGRILRCLAAAGIPSYVGSCPEIYRERAFEGTNFAPIAALPVAHRLGDTSLLLLVHPNLSEAAIDYAGDMLAAIVTAASA